FGRGALPDRRPARRLHVLRRERRLARARGPPAQPPASVVRARPPLRHADRSGAPRRGRANPRAAIPSRDRPARRGRSRCVLRPADRVRVRHRGGLLMARLVLVATALAKAFAVAVVFVAAMGASAILHMSLAAPRRLLAAAVNDTLDRTFRGNIDVRRLE